MAKKSLHAAPTGSSSSTSTPSPPTGSTSSTTTPAPPTVAITKTYEFRVYAHMAGYSSDFELIGSTVETFYDAYISSSLPPKAKEEADTYARNIGLLGITFENPIKQYTYYPPTSIAKVEFTEIAQDIVFLK